MIEKMKKFFKKYWVFISIAIVILILLVFIIFFLQKESEMPPSNGNDVIDTTPDGESPSIPEEFLSVQQPLSYHKNYEIDFSTGVLNQIEQKEGKYFAYRVKMISHFNWAENFVEAIGKRNLSYTKNEIGEEKFTHYWENNDEYITYDEGRDFLSVNLIQPMSIPGVNFKPSNKTDLKESLSVFVNNYFSSDFEYEINNISISGNFYEVDYSRILENTSIHLELPKQQLLLTPDGRLKEMTILLTEFEKFEDLQYPLINPTELKENISSVKYPKTVNFEILDTSVQDDYDTHGYIAYSRPFTQEGSIEVTEVEIVYFYVNSSQEVLAPTFLFNGEGFLDVDGSSTRSRFTVLASAIDPKYVYIHPDSHFEMLESLE